MKRSYKINKYILVDKVTYHIKLEVSNVRDRYDEFTEVILIIFGSAGQTLPLTLTLNKEKQIEEFDFEALDVGTVSSSSRRCLRQLLLLCILSIFILF